MKKAFLLIVLLFVYSEIFAQPPSIEWQTCLGGSYNEIAQSIVRTSDGGYIVAGYTNSNDNDVSGNHGNTDVWIVKISSIGVLEWQKCLGGSIKDIANNVQQTSDGGYIIAGYTNSNDGNVSGYHDNFFSYDFWIIKLSSKGNLEWQKCLGGRLSDVANNIQQTSDGGFIIAGYTISTDGDVKSSHEDDGHYDFWIVKLSSKGNLEWQKCLGGSSDDTANDIQQTSDGGFIVAGLTTSNDGDVSGHHGGFQNTWDYWIVKLNSTGNLEWQKCLGGPDNDWANSISQTSDGGYIVAGYTYSNYGDISGKHELNKYNSDAWIVKLSSTGNLEWQKCLGGSFNDQANDIRQVSDGGYIIAGYTESNDGDITDIHGGLDAWIVKLNSKGDLEWQKCFGGSSLDVANSIKMTLDGSYIVAGYTNSNDGDVSCHHGTDNYSDFWIVKLSKETGIDEPTTPNLLEENINITPNPSSGIITIKTSGQALDNYIIIYDVYGRQVYSDKINGNEVTIDVSGFASGAYSAVIGKDRKMFVVNR